MVKKLSTAAVIAALYAALTLLLSPISFGAFQLRLSEAMCILALFTPAAVPGLAIGCFLANIIGPNGFMDALIGSLCTLLAAYLIYRLREKPALAPLLNAAINGLGIGLELYYLYGEPMSPWLCILWVFIGEIASGYAFGWPCYRYLKAHPGLIRF